MTCLILQIMGTDVKQKMLSTNCVMEIVYKPNIRLSLGCTKVVQNYTKQMFLKAPLSKKHIYVIISLIHK